MFLESLTPRIASIIIFVAIIAIIIWRDRENIERHSVLIVRRTRKGIEFIKKVANRHSKIWKIYSTIGVYLSLVITVVGFLFLGYNVLRSLVEAGIDPAIGLVLPTVSQTPSMAPGVFFIPFWYWIIGVATVMVIHEMMHGVVGANEGFKIKSVGWLLLVILPGAFVEPEGEEMLPEDKEDDGEQEDEEDDGTTNPWGDGPVMSKLRVLAAGSWSNLCFAVVVGLLIFAVAPTTTGQAELRGFYEHEGIRIAQVGNETPAMEQGLREDMIINNIGGKRVEHLMDFQEATQGLKANETITIAGRYNESEFEKNITMDVSPAENMTYDPAVLDKLFIKLERNFPGVYERYMSFQDLFLDDNPQTKIARWEWLQEQGVMEDRPEEEIRRLEEEHEPSGYIGISIAEERNVKERYATIEPVAVYILQLLMFLVIIHSGVAIANLLPMIPLDGGWMISEIINEYKPEWENLPKYISYVTLALFLLTLGLPILL